MAKHGKKYRAAFEKVEQRPYQLDEAFQLLKSISYAKFNETVELSMLLGVDPKHADQMVRGTTVLPHGTGQTKRVLVIAQGESSVRRRKPVPTWSEAKRWWRRSRVAGSISTPSSPRPT